MKQEIVESRYLVSLAHQLDASGIFAGADLLDRYAAGQFQIYNPDQFGKTIADIVNNTINSVSSENRSSFRQSMVEKITALNSAELSNRHRNPGAAIGAITSLLKNMLSGKDAGTVVAVLRAILKNIH